MSIKTMTINTMTMTGDTALRPQTKTGLGHVGALTATATAAIADVRTTDAQGIPPRGSAPV